MRPLTSCIAYGLTTFPRPLPVDPRFYNSNKFYFPDTAGLYAFLNEIGRAYRQEIAKIVFYWEGRQASEAFALLRQCTNLQTLEVQIDWCKIAPYDGYEELSRIRGLQDVEIILHEGELGPQVWSPRLRRRYLHELRAKMLRARRGNNAVGNA